MRNRITTNLMIADDNNEAAVKEALVAHFGREFEDFVIKMTLNITVNGKYYHTADYFWEYIREITEKFSNE